jgi:hypothetical protein
VCALLLSQGASVKQATNDGSTPLSIAAQNGHEAVCELLLSHGASVNQAMNDGSTPLSIAAQNGHDAVCALLLSHGASVNQADNYGFTPLYLAAQNGHESVYALLLSQDTSVNQACSNGFGEGISPLLSASAQGCESFIKPSETSLETVSDSSHPHPLIKTKDPYGHGGNGGIRCNICGLPCLVWSYHCKLCKYDAHLACLSSSSSSPAPTTTSSSPTPAVSSIGSP